MQASETDDSSDGEGANALRSLVNKCRAQEEADKPEGDMEITWDVGLKEKAEVRLPPLCFLRDVRSGA